MPRREANQARVVAVNQARVVAVNQARVRAVNQARVRAVRPRKVKVQLVKVKASPVNHHQEVKLACLLKTHQKQLHHQYLRPLMLV